MSQEFWNNGDLLHQLGDKIISRKSLWSLCLVNRRSNEVFSKNLWNCLELNEDGGEYLRDEEQRQVLLNCKNLQFVKILILWCSNEDLFVNIEEESEDGDKDSDEDGNNEEDNDEDDGDGDEDAPFPYNRGLVELLKRTPNLTSAAFYEMELTNKSLEALAELQHLKSLVIQFPEQMQNAYVVGYYSDPEESKRHEQKGTLGNPQKFIRRFRNLERLSLLRVWGDYVSWKECVLKVVVESPNLKHLSLSANSELIDQLLSEEEVDVTRRQIQRFMSDICDRYGKTSKDKLRLQTLRVGDEIIFPNRTQLQRLTDMTFLEDIHVDASDQDVGDPMPWSSLEHEAVPKLRQVSVHYLFFEDLEALEDGIAITDDDEHDEFVSAYTTCMERLVEHIPERLFVSALPALFRLGEETGHLKGDGITHLGVWFRIDRILDHEGDVEENEDAFSTLCDILAIQPKLEALWLIGAGVTARFEAEAQKEAERRVLQLATSISTLRYVRLDSTSWIIHREGAIRLEELDAWEDQVIGPDFFHVPAPVRWSDLVRHAEFKL